jgi:hypothetical protein
MLSIISFIQPNLQHRIAASKVFPRTAAVKGTYMALIQEPLVYMRRRNRPTACILARNMNVWMLPGFSTRDPVAVQIK